MMVLRLFLFLRLFAGRSNNKRTLQRLLDIVLLVFFVSLLVFFKTSSRARRKLFGFRNRSSLWNIRIGGRLSHVGIVIPTLEAIYCISAMFSGWLGYME